MGVEGGEMGWGGEEGAGRPIDLEKGGEGCLCEEGREKEAEEGGGEERCGGVAGGGGGREGWVGVWEGGEAREVRACRWVWVGRGRSTFGPNVGFVPEAFLRQMSTPFFLYFRFRLLIVI